MYMYSAQNVSSDHACMVSAVLEASRLRLTADLSALVPRLRHIQHPEEYERGKDVNYISCSHTRLIRYLKLDLGLILAG